SASASSSRKAHVRRPPNCFIVYRMAMREKVLKEIGSQCNNTEVSKVVARWWKNEPEDVREQYREKAKQLSEEHKRRYPDYKYQPRKR
ncbi:high mobility group box domain-containing protein, partial [Thamnocephalis sphaerospora]